ncbi:MAG TPA: PD-(D/E)XK nuclease family protein [Vicinamibacterales bacterium]|nr:PD-(D/E)XK nuclease family protein [Vicinamibacterales bacterium]
MPTRAAAELLRQSIEAEARRTGRTAVLLPDLLTRDDLVTRLHGALPGAPPLVSRAEREILLERAARRAAGRARMPGSPFHIRPGLVAAMLDFYDELRRRERTIRRFARALFAELRVERGTDRGSEGLIHQTSFLGFAFLGYERGLASSGRLDEHALWRRLAADQPALPFEEVVVAVADHPSDPRGLWPADFNLLGRLTGIARLDVVVTDETHDAGFRERIDRELPGIEEQRPAGAAAAPPVLVRPSAGESLCFVSRDREEELRDVVRGIRRRLRDAGGVLPERTAVVFHRPLPYLYLAHQILSDARIPYQTFDALPLAAEPFAALLDLVLAFARTGGTREAAVALLRSQLLRFEVSGERVGRRDAAALDAVLAERRATGEAATYPAEVEAFFGGLDRRDRVERDRARRAAEASAALRERLQPFRSAAAASLQIRAVSDLLRASPRAPDDDDPWRDRHARAREAVLAVLDGLTDAFRRHDDRPRDPEDLVAAVHHALEGRTFSPRRGRAGVHLVDAVAARFGDADHAYLVGLVETDWPDRQRRSIFYSSGLLKNLGWPQESDQVRAQQAAFRDLLRLPAKTVELHAFQLEGDAIVGVSPMVEAARDLPSRALSEAEEAGARAEMCFAEDALAAGGEAWSALDEESAAWLDLRRRRPSIDGRSYGGFVGAQAPQAYRVSRVDRYLDCPFKYFAESVLGLPEEREEMSGLTPLERGNLVHSLFERFYRAWQEDGRGTITDALLPDALRLFRRLAHEALARMPEADRALEEVRLFGSIVARGLAERVFELEAHAGGRIVRRLIEFPIRGPFTFWRLSGLVEKVIEIRGKTDRIDVFDDGSLRVIDYKLGRMPDLKSSVQIAVYAHSVQQALEASEGRPHPVSGAMYVAFGDDRHVAGAIGEGEPPGEAVAARASQFAGLIERIEQGEFPPQPRKTSDCAWCRYAGVCRKEYRLEADEAAEPV